MYHTEYLLPWGLVRIAYAAAESVPGSPSPKDPQRTRRSLSSLPILLSFSRLPLLVSVGAESHAHGPTRRPINAVTGITVKFATLPSFSCNPPWHVVVGPTTRPRTKDEGCDLGLGWETIPILIPIPIHTLVFRLLVVTAENRSHSNSLTQLVNITHQHNVMYVRTLYISMRGEKHTQNKAFQRAAQVLDSGFRLCNLAQRSRLRM